MKGKHLHRGSTLVRPKTVVITKNKEMKNMDKHKILLIGDSHIKRCAAELRLILDQGYVLGFSKPGARTSNILETAKNEVAALSNKDFLILWAGSNYIYKNNE
jgi:hypothetical protein